MKLIIAGGRDFNNYERLELEVAAYIFKHIGKHIGIEIISGACHKGVHTFTRHDGTKVYGADGLGERYAEGFGLPVKYFPAMWQKYKGKSAAYHRNKAMAEYATDCIVFWDGKSKGTKMMLDLANEHKLKVKEVRY